MATSASSELEHRAIQIKVGRRRSKRAGEARANAERDASEASGCSVDVVAGAVDDQRVVVGWSGTAPVVTVRECGAVTAAVPCQCCHFVLPFRIRTVSCLSALQPFVLVSAS